MNSGNNVNVHIFMNDSQHDIIVLEIPVDIYEARVKSADSLVEAQNISRILEMHDLLTYIEENCPILETERVFNMPDWVCECRPYSSGSGLFYFDRVKPGDIIKVYNP